jgi:hypothetical protein
MVRKTFAYCGTAVAGLAVLLAAWPGTRPSAQQENGPEAGVWVIAETTELGTRFAKIAVTDDHGRYVIPDLPQATYSVWVRGYGLVDSPRVKSVRGRIVNLTAVPAPLRARPGPARWSCISSFAQIRSPIERATGARASRYMPSARRVGDGACSIPNVMSPTPSGST